MTIESAPPDEDATETLEVEDLLEVDEDSEPPDAAQELEQGPAAEDRLFYAQEAQALVERQPERAALMWIEAASVEERAGGSQQRILGDLERALDLRPESPWLLPRARRMLMRLGAYERAMRLGQREVKIGGDNAARASVLFEGSAIVRYHLGKREPALAMVENALRLQPRFIAALARAVSLRSQVQKHTEMAAELEQLGETLGDPEQRALCLYTAGTIREARLGQDDAAQAAYMRAAEADPKHLPAVLALCGLHERTGKWDRLCRALEHLAELVEDDGVRARLLHQAGSLHLDKTGDLEAATRDLSRAVHAKSDDAAAVRRLAYAYEAKGRQRELVQTLRRLLELTLDSQGRAAVLTQIGDVLDRQLHEQQEAIGAYREAIDELPGYLPALQALGTLYRSQGDHENLVAISQPEAEGLLPAEARAVRHLANAELLAKELDRPDDAIGAFHRALELAPTMHLAYWGLADVLKSLDLFDELGALLRQQAEVSSDPRTKTHIQLELARLQAGPLEQPERAITTLLSADADAQARSVAFDLIALYLRSDRYDDLVPLLLDQAAATKDSHEAEARKIQAAQILELRLEEGDRALEIFKQVLADNPKNMAALHGAGRILHRRGAWNDLIRLHHHELSHDPERFDAAILLCRVGRLLADHLGNAKAAINAYSKALRQDPTCSPALVALEGLVRAEQRWPELVKVLEQYAEARNDGVAAAAALQRAAEVAGWELGELDRAADLYQQAHARHEGGQVALHGLLRVRLRQQAWAPAAEVLRELIESSSSDEERAQLQLQLARLREFRLDESPDLELYERAAAGAFGDRLREELTRIRWLIGAPEMAGWLTDLGKRTNDQALAAAYLVEAAHIYEFAPGELDSIEPIERAYEISPDDPVVIWSLERGLLRQGMWAELAELREKEAQLELDRWVRVQLLASAAEAYWQDGATEDAERVCRECLNFDAHCLPALRLLARLAEESQQWAELAELCDRLAEACTDRSNRLASCLRAADLWADQVQDSARALSSLAVALADDPGQPDAFSRAEALLRSRGEYEELSRLLQRRIRSCEGGAEKVELLRKHADLLRNDIKHPVQAISELNALLELAPADLPALTELADLHGQQQHWSDAAATLGLVIERAEDPDARHRARLRQAELWLNRLHEPKRARGVLEAASAERPDDIEVKKFLVELATTVGDWEDARQLLEQVAAEADGGARIWALLQLAEVTQLGLRDDGLSERCEKEAVALAAKDSAALEALRAHYPAPEQKLRLVEIAEQHMEDAAPGEVGPLRELVGRILLDDLDQPARALPYLQKLLDDDPDNREVSMLLARVLEREGDGSKAGRHYMTLLGKDVGAVEAYRGLVRVGTTEVAAAAAAIVELWGEVGPEEAVQLKALGGEQSPRGVFAADQLDIGENFAELEEALGVLSTYLEAVYTREAREVIDPNHPADAAVQQLARCLGVGRVRVEFGTELARVGIGTPLPLAISAELAEQSDQPIFRFWIGRALALAIGGGAIVQQLSDAELEELFDAVYTKKPLTSTAQQLKKNLSRLLPRKVRKSLEQLKVPGFDQRVWSAYRGSATKRANRLALVLSRHPGIALRELAKSARIEPKQIAHNAELSPLLRFVVSGDYVRLYRGVWR